MRILYCLKLAEEYKSDDYEYFNIFITYNF